MSGRCGPGGFAAELADTLADYSHGVSVRAVEAIDQTTDELLRDLRRASKVSFRQRTGGYARGWTKRTEYQSGTAKRNRVYNRKGGLTHLLERGHAKPSGGRVSGRAHIKPAEERANQALEERIEKAVKER